MASLRIGTRKDGAHYTQVLYRHKGRQCSTSYEDHESAVRFRDLIQRFGVDKALEIERANQNRGDPDMSVEGWIAHHIDRLTGVTRGTRDKYRAHLRNDITPAIGALPPAALTREDVARWINEGLLAH